MQNIHRYNEKSATIDHIDFSVLPNADIKRGSALGRNTSGITIPDYYDNGEPKKDGLIDQRMGVTNNDLECHTCGFDTVYCTGHFGHLDLAEPVYNVHFFDYVVKILKCVCINCSKLIIYKNEAELISMLKSKRGKNRLTEFKSIVKNISYCQKSDYGCGAPIPKIKANKQKSTATINITAEYSALISTEENPDKTSTKEILSTERVLNILKNISDEACLILGIDPKKNRPEDLITVCFPVPPVSMRPSIRGDAGSSSTKEDQTTGQIGDILKASNKILKKEEKMNDKNIKYFSDDINYLQYVVASYQDNSIGTLPQSMQKGQPTKSLSSRLKGKEGRIRGNLMAKRVDFSARTVITSDPMLPINGLGLPISMAKNLTFPETVTPYNKEYLEHLIKNGPDKYPGANYIIKNSVSEYDGRFPIDFRFRKEKIELRYGDIVERHLVNGDIVLLNRQPTLHKQSMMGHIIRVIDNPDYCTFRLNPNVVTPYNADFDGDEMNIFVSQSVQAQIELEQITDVKLQVITPQSSAPIIGLIQDALLGSYNMTVDTMNIDWRNVMNLLSGTDITNYDILKKNIIYFGKDVYSYVIPKRINLKLEGKINVINGNIVTGTIDFKSMGIKQKNNLIQMVWDEYGVEKTKRFLDNTSRLSNGFNMYRGFTAGIGDLFVTKDIADTIEQLCETKKLEILHEITAIENNPVLYDEKLIEPHITFKLDNILEDVSTLLMKTLSPDNAFKIMIGSKSKGKPSQIGQMAGCVGQTSYEGLRMPKNYGNRTSPHFLRNDDGVESRGFIKSSFLSGLNLSEFIFNTFASREGNIDSAVKSVTPDTMIIIKTITLGKEKIKCVKIGDFVDKQMNKVDNYEHITRYSEQNLEVLKSSSIYKKYQVPTLYNNGTVIWGDISNFTRHDKGMQLYEVRTKSGRIVKVPESKSLLIYDIETNMFNQMNTPDIKIGDFVPVAVNLGKSVPSGSFVECGIPITFTTEENMYLYNMELNMNNIFCEMDIKNLTIHPITTGNHNENPKYMMVNDVILDPVTSITLIENNYYKLYDLTIPETSNFIIASGLGIYDTAESGYVQRKLVKSTEDFMVKYDGTVRNASDRIQQFVYGDSGVDTVKQYGYNFNLMEMTNTKIAEIYKFTKKELEQCNKFTEQNNEEYYLKMLNIRDHLRQTQIKACVNYMKLNTNFMIGVNIDRIIDGEIHAKIRDKTIVDPYGEENLIVDIVEDDGKICYDVSYILKLIENILSNNKTKLYPMMVEEMNDETSIRYNDEIVAKTVFRYSLYDALAPKKCILVNKFSKKQLNNIAEKIIYSFNNAIAEPGEMVGILGAQSIGEPVTQMTLNTFHSSGIGGMGAVSLGVPRIKEVLSLSKNLKEPQMIIYLDEEHRYNKHYANKLAYHIKYTTIKDLRKTTEIYYDPYPYEKDGFMERDNVFNIFYGFQQSKSCCMSSIVGLPWLTIVKFDKDKLLSKGITLLEIKTHFCSEWENRHHDMKTLKRDKKAVLEKITQLAVLSNDENDAIPILHIRFDMNNFNSSTLVDFIDMFVDDFKLKGMANIDDIRGDNAKENSIITFDNSESEIIEKKENVIYTKGVNMIAIRDIEGVDLTRTYCNDIIKIYEMFGIEAARVMIMTEIRSVFVTNETDVNYQHISIFGDLMTNIGTLTSIDRHGLHKLDTDPLSRASFEQAVEQLVNAAICNETDRMKSVSSRIMAGLCIKGGTGLCSVVLDREMLEKSEYTEYNDVETGINTGIEPSNLVQEMDEEMFIPDF